MLTRLPLLPCGHQRFVRSSGLTIGKSYASWPSGTRISAIIGPEWFVASMPSWPSSHREESPRKCTFLTLMTSWTDSVPRPRPSRCASTWPSSSSTMCVDSMVRLKESHRRIRVAIKASGTSLTEIYGVGPIDRCNIDRLLGRHRSVRQPGYLRLLQRHGTRRVLSGRRVVHRVSRRGSRRLKHALHMAAITQIRNPGVEGRIYFERKVAEGKTKKEAVRSLKRQISNAAYRQLLLDVR